MRMTDSRYERDQRRLHLAWRMLQLSARRQTIAEWTGLSPFRIRSLFKSYCAPYQVERHRGPVIKSPSFLFRSLQIQCESAALAHIGLQLEIIPKTTVANVVSWINVGRGQSVVAAYRLYRSLVPHTRFDFDKAIYLLSELATQENLLIERCLICQEIMVIRRYEIPGL